MRSKIPIVHKDERALWETTPHKDIKAAWTRLVSVGPARLTDSERAILHRLPVKLRETFSWTEPDQEDYARCLLNAQDLRTDTLVSVLRHAKGSTALAPWKLEPRL